MKMINKSAGVLIEKEKMMRKRTRRIIALIILVVLVSSLADLTKAIVAVPLIELLLIDWSDFSFEYDKKTDSSKSI